MTQGWMQVFVDQFGYLGIFLLILIENIFPPIPSEVVLLFGGALTVTTHMNIPGTILAATAGSVAGAIALYALGRVFQAERLKRLFAGKFGQVLHLKPAYVDKAEQWFLRYQGKAVLICRCIPVVRSLISIPAGFAKMKIPRFLFLTTLGSAAWNTVLVSAGAGLGTAWERAMPYLEHYKTLVVVVAALLVLAAAGYYLVTRHRKSSKSSESNAKCESSENGENGK
ncbi:MAG: DedA family protein [Gemmiger sp.]|nr:DedA family protein [Gemmiger sp.]